MRAISIKKKRITTRKVKKIRIASRGKIESNKNKNTSIKNRIYRHAKNKKKIKRAKSSR